MCPHCIATVLLLGIGYVGLLKLPEPPLDADKEAERTRGPRSDEPHQPPKGLSHG
mgnify:CR=1